jgi:hypothetical protein
MITDSDVDRALRRASDDVLATVVRTADPPAVASLDRPRRSSPAIAYVLAAATIAGVFALGRIRQGDDDLAPAAVAPTITSLAAGTSSAATAPIGAAVTGADVCAEVATVAIELAALPTEVEAWEDIGRRVDRIEAALADADLDEAGRRDIARFVVLAGRAAELGADGGSYPARPMAGDAVVVAASIAERFERCTIDPSSSTSEPITSPDMEEVG